MRATHRQRLELHRLGLLLGRMWPAAIAYASELAGDPELTDERAEEELRRLRRRALKYDIPLDGLLDDPRSCADPFMPGDTFPRPPKGGYTY